MFDRRKFIKSGLCLAAPSVITNAFATNLSAAQANTPPPLSGLNLADLQRKQIPNSGVSVPMVGIGTNRYGASDQPEVIAELKKVLAEFSEIGNGIIDTAPQYRHSEQVLGQLLGELKRHDEFFIATKCDLNGGTETYNQVLNSGQLLGKTPLDLVAIHNLKYWQAQLPVLQELKIGNVVQHVGITTSRQSQYADMEKILRSQSLDFIQLNYSILDRAADQRLLDIAKDKGVAVMVNLPFGRRKFFAKVGQHSLPQWTQELGIKSWAQFALKYIVSHPAVTCAIPGTRKLKHLNDNLQAAMGPMPSAIQRTKMEVYFDQL